MLQKQLNAKCKILVATDSDKQKRRLMGYLVACGYRTHCVSASELLKNPSGLKVTAPDLVVLDLDSQTFDASFPLSAHYAKRHGCHILYSLDPGEIKKFKSDIQSDELTYVANNCGGHELELGVTVLRLKAREEKDARDRRREQWALQALSCVAQRSETRENTIDGIVGIVATALDAACCVLKKDARSELYHDVASAGASKEDLKKLNSRSMASDTTQGTNEMPAIKAEYTPPGPWRPAAKLVAPISVNASSPTFLYVWSDEPREFSGAERTLVSVAALYTGLAISSPYYEDRA